MQSVRIWIIAGTTGALIGAASMYSVIGNDRQPGSVSGIDRAETLPRASRMDMPATSVNNQTSQGSTYVSNEAKPTQDIKTGAPAVGPATVAVTKPVPAEEEATVQVITARLRDPSYTYSNTLSDVMQSAEMRKLSDQSRERVVAEMMGMINRGEIDARTFMASQK